MLHDLFTRGINGKMSGGLNTSASNCSLVVSSLVLTTMPHQVIFSPGVDSFDYDKQTEKN